MKLPMLNDTYYFLKFGEDPLDPDDPLFQKDVAETRDLIPEGYILGDNPESVEEPGWVQVDILPSQISGRDLDYDRYLQLSPIYRILIKLIDGGTKVRVWSQHNGCPERFRGEFRILTDGLPRFILGDGDFTAGKSSMFFLSCFKEKGT